MTPTPISIAVAVAPQVAPPVMERARGAARVVLRADGPTTRLFENYQSGSAKVRFPRGDDRSAIGVVLLNTAGGVTGGDHLTYAATAEEGAAGVVTTQAAERIYRRSAGTARIDTSLTVAAGAALDWLPQETIVFDGAALSRTLTADVHPGGRLLAVESVVLGRTAMGERATNVTIADAWRIRRGGALISADTLKLDGDAASAMAGGATGGGAVAVATLLLVAPDAEARIDTARAALAGVEGGASAWNGMLVARLIAATGQDLRAGLMRLIEALSGRPLPRVWHC